MTVRDSHETGVQDSGSSSSYSGPSRRSVLVASAGVGLTAGLAGCLDQIPGGGSDTQSKTEFTFSAGPSDAMAFAMGNQIASTLKQSSEYTMHVTSNAGEQIVVNLLKGDAELSYSSVFMALDVVNRRGAFSEIEINHEPMHLTSFYSIDIGLLAKTSSDVEYMSDLSGKTIAPGPSGAAYWDPVDYSLSNFVDGFQKDYEHSSVSQFSSYLSSGRALAVGGPYNINGIIPGYIQQIHSQNDTRLLTWTEDSIEAIRDDPRISGRRISNDKLGDANEFVTSPDTFLSSLRYNLWGSDLLPEQSAYDLLKTVWEARANLPDAHAGFNPWTEGEFWTSNFSPEIPVHPGAAEFLKEKDLWSDEYTVGDV